jgi:hypothetical protein
MQLVLRRANVSRKGGHWNDDSEREVGRIFKASVEERRQLATIQFCKAAVMRRLYFRCKSLQH